MYKDTCKLHWELDNDAYRIAVGNSGGHCYVGCSFPQGSKSVISAQHSTSCRSEGTGLAEKLQGDLQRLAVQQTSVLNVGPCADFFCASHVRLGFL